MHISATSQDHILPVSYTHLDVYKRQVIDQDAVNELVDYAIAHGVNYFDTSPVYCQGSVSYTHLDVYKRQVQTGAILTVGWKMVHSCA